MGENRVAGEEVLRRLRNTHRYHPVVAVSQDDLSSITDDLDFFYTWPIDLVGTSGCEAKRGTKSF